jgi:spermidine/putrescine transport system substrate-binding protein
MIDVYAKRGWLAAIAPEKIPNLVNLQARWRTAFPESEQYGVPYFWGTLGIAYRRDLAPNGFDKWSQFFRPQKSLRGRLAMPKSSRDVLGMALKSLGYSANTDDRGAIREAAAMLEAQKPFVHSYEYVSLDEQSALVTGRVWASMIYNGDALMLSNHHEDIVYVIPEEGTNLWVDYLAIMQRSPRRDLAAKFIDFLNRPRIAARNAQYVNYSTPNTAARSHLSKDYLDDPTIHPSDAVLARSEVYHKLSPRSQKTLNSVFVHLFAR